MNPDLPPPNRAIGWYRFMLWMMPACIAVTTAFGFGWLASALRIRLDRDFMAMGWFAINTLSTIGIAIFEAKLRSQSDAPVLLGFKSRVIGFVLAQLLIIPAVTFTIAFAACLVLV
jgi:ABC-type enterobactin transport system permease subunit